jgi:hypothetical protein
MTRRIDEFLPDLVGELDYREEVAYTETVEPTYDDIELID